MHACMHACIPIIPEPPATSKEKPLLNRSARRGLGHCLLSGTAAPATWGSFFDLGCGGVGCSIWGLLLQGGRGGGGGLCSGLRVSASVRQGLGFMESSRAARTGGRCLEWNSVQPCAFRYRCSWKLASRRRPKTQSKRIMNLLLELWKFNVEGLRHLKKSRLSRLIIRVWACLHGSVPSLLTLT